MRYSYVLTIWDLFKMNGNDGCGSEVVIAIMDGDEEVDRITLSGNYQNQDGYRRGYTGKSGLTARLASGVGSISFELHNSDSVLAAVGLGLSGDWGSGRPT